MIADTMALARYVWTKNRTLTKILLSLAVATEIAFLTATMLSVNETWRGGIAAINVSAIGICILYTVVLFEFGKSSNLTSCDGNYDGWLLRLPIPSWKLALIPIGFITVWMVVMWSMLAITVQSLGVRCGPIIIQSLASSAIAIGTLAINWSTQRYPWQRGVTFFLNLPALFALSLLSLIGVGNADAPAWVPAVGAWLAVVCYVASIALAMRGVRFARVSAYQQQIEGGANVLDRITGTIIKWFESWKVTGKQFTSPVAALRWHDLARSQANRWRLIGLFVFIIALSIVIFRLAASPTSVAVFGFFFAFVGSSAVACIMFEPPVWANQTSLPSYLIVSPLSPRTIAWTRLVSTISVITKFFAFVSLIFLVNYLVDSNQELPTRLSRQIASFAVSDSPIRTILACHLGVFLLSISFALNSIWVQFTGRQQHGLAISVVGVLVVSFPVSVTLIWFMKQTQWEVVIATRTYWMERLPSILYAVATIKLGITAWTIFLALQQQVVAVKLTLKIVAVWGVGVIVAATAFWLIWPGSDLPFHAVLIAAMLLFPLAVIFGSPLAVDANRHRGGLRSYYTNVADPTGVQLRGNQRT